MKTMKDQVNLKDLFLLMHNEMINGPLSAFIDKDDDIFNYHFSFKVRDREFLFYIPFDYKEDYKSIHYIKHICEKSNKVYYDITKDYDLLKNEITCAIIITTS